jgi:L-serine dehydratase
MFVSIGVFDLFTVGIGPSSSHTVGPMRAAADFVSRIDADLATRVQVDLYGSLAATGRGHGTLTAVLLGLEGLQPDEVLPAQVEERTAAIRDERRVRVGGTGGVPLCEDDVILHPLTILPGHTNGLRLKAWDAAGELLDDAVYYSTGGGFIVRDGEQAEAISSTPVPFPFETAAELLAHCEREGVSMAEIQRRNERASRSDDEITGGILQLADVMADSVASGAAREGMLPGGLRWRRSGRMDLRNHRKIAVIDNEVGYVGSQNLARPEFVAGHPNRELVARVQTILRRQRAASPPASSAQRPASPCSSPPC